MPPAPRRRTRKTPAKKNDRTPRVVIAILLTVLILFVLLSLGCWVAGLRSPHTNYCGWLGHWIAFGLHYALGQAAFVLPVFGAAAALLSRLRQPPWRRFAAFGALTAALLLAAMLLSYQSGSPTPLDNFGGWLGAAVGRALSGLLGLGAWVVPALALVWAAAAWRGQYARRGNFVLSAFILLLGLLVIVFAGYAAPDRPIVPGPGPAFTAPGSAGKALTGALRDLLGTVGTLIVLIAAALLFIALFTTIELRSPEGLLRRLREA
ncbi:DNA translocase FtsK 4TM domain-containing protein, partial [candidate division WOR-3 bacterium]|nr:DNA translocase FtsK 4TM domain-containing protein [candidate division WOR-3 bacterium]